MRKIGITGSIGAGKSLVSSLLRERGYTVLDADSQVHELYRDSKELRAELAEAFGPQSLTESGVNRKFFAGLIFGDVHARERLEGIVYPHLTRAVREFLDDNPNGAANAQPRFLEAAILSRVPEIVGMLDEIWVVTANEDVRLKRLIENRGFTEEDARRRIELQHSRDSETYWKNLFPKKTVRFIDNSSDETALKKIIESLL